jgi:hypothetical protein
MQDNGHGLTIRVNFVVNVCVSVGFEFNGFVIKAQSFPMDGHTRTNIISNVGHLSLDLVMSQVLCLIAVQYPRHWYCTIDLSG